MKGNEQKFEKDEIKKEVDEGDSQNNKEKTEEKQSLEEAHDDDEEETTRKGKSGEKLKIKKN